MIRRMTFLLFLLLSLSVAAQQEKKDIEELRATMYRLYNTDSIEKFMATTDRMMELTRKTGDERTFYKAWCNKALFTFRKIDRSKGLEMVKEIKAFAEQEDSKYGLYSATSANVTILSSMNQPQLAERVCMSVSITCTVISPMRVLLPTTSGSVVSITIRTTTKKRWNWREGVFRNLMCSQYTVKPLMHTCVSP